MVRRGGPHLGRPRCDDRRDFPEFLPNNGLDPMGVKAYAVRRILFMDAPFPPGKGSPPMSPSSLASASPSKPPSTRACRPGFTLIELLIVIAIIAVLALIAVPNFLEAQTRALVSRSTADMASVATALETYNMDHGAFLVDVDGYRLSGNTDIGYFKYVYRLIRLTTPIPYLSAVPEDPFAVRNAAGFLPQYQEPYQFNGQFVHPMTYDYAVNDGHVMTQTEWINVWQYISHTQSVIWSLRGEGPDGMGSVLGTPNTPVYSPTNGTLSGGDIYRLGPGIGARF